MWAWIAALLLASNMAIARVPKDIDGGKTYTSKTKRFTVVVPKARNWAVHRFRVREVSHPDFHGRPEEAFFEISDFGELYRFGVVDLVPEIRTILKLPETPNAAEPKPILEAILRMHYMDKLPGEIRWNSIKEFASSLGPGAIGLCSVDGGSRLLSLKGEEIAEAAKTGKLPAPKPGEAKIGIVAVLAGDRLVFALAQNDYENQTGTDPEASFAAVATSLAQMMGTAKLGK